MTTRRQSFVRGAALTLALLLVCLIPVWFCAPMRVESLDSLTYCACGYSTVRLHDGTITMVKYFHNSVKPGEQIGTYRVAGNQVELEIIFKGKAYRNTYVLDNIGLVNPPVPYWRPYPYCAINEKSPKTYIYFIFVRLREGFTRWWRNF